MKRLAVLSFFFSAVGGVFSPATVWACAVCLTGASGNDPLADAFNWSVLFLMAMPYTVLGSIGAWLYCAYRRAAVKEGKIKAEKAPLQLAWIQKENAK